MKALKYWVYGIAFDVVIAGLFYLWQFEGLEGAGNALQLYLWVTIGLTFLVAITNDKEKEAKNPRPYLFTQYRITTRIILVLALAWMGHMWTAALYLVTMLLMEASRTAEPKHKDAQ